LGVPIVGRRGDVLGGLFLFHSQPDRLPEYEQRLAIGLARRAGVLLDNARLYSEAQEVQEQLRAMNQAKTEFIGVMSHELRTPITTIYGGARLLRNRRKSLPEESTEEMIASIEEEAERLYRLVEDLLALARSELGDEISTAPLHLASVVDRVVKQFATYRPARPIEVRIASSAAVVQAETTYLFQVLHNLVTNADKYSDAGLPIEIEAKGDGNEVTVRVLDRGPGVDKSEIDQIFDSFYRSERTAKRASGKGLGLTVCRRLIEAMSGRIWATPRPEGGLEVAFSLPVGAQEPAELEAASERR
jgi:K+-sensing histidine kinase KdpD